MSAGSLVLDITKTPQANLLAKFNLINATQLLESDFVFGVPGPEQDTRRTTNTQVELIPALGSRFYNSFTLHYDRMDIESILDNPLVSIPRGTGDNLSDLIDEINEAYGIKLTSDDYYDTPLAPVNDLDPTAEVPVQIAIKPESYLFTGSYLLALNRAVTTPSLEGEDDANVYVVVNNASEPAYKSRVRAYTLAGELIAGFVFLRNAIVVTHCVINKVIQLKNKDFALLGDFEFTSSFEGGAQQSYNVKTIVMTPAGAIRSVSVPGLFGATLNLTHYNRRGSDYVYSVSSGAVIRYTQAGVLDFGFTPENPGYVPELIQECPDGKYYTVSPPISVQVDHDGDPGTPTVPFTEIRIDRFNANGTLDVSFTQVVMRRDDGGAPWTVVNIAPVFTGNVGNGFYVGLAPTVAPSNTLPVPLINGVPLVPANESSEYGVIPVVKFNQAGVWTQAFANAQRNLAPAAVYYPPTSGQEVVGNRTVVASEDGAVFLTRRMNPITGLVQRMPVAFDNTGAMQKIAGGEYYLSYRWEAATQMRRLTNGTLIVWGTRVPHNLAGGWSAPVASVCAYQSDTRAQNVVADIAAAGESLHSVLINEE